LPSSNPASAQCIALLTGHENGLVTLWNSDAGTNLSSHALTNPLTCLVEANSNKAHILMGSDFSGMIAVWNLTLFKINPKSLPLGSLFKGHHDPEEASILSLAFHKSTNTFFSGGTDTNICCWRLDSLNFTTLTNHSAAVVSLQCTENYLLSGDEAGELILWHINVLVDQSSNTESSLTGNNQLPELNKLVRWYGLQSQVAHARSIISLKEIDPHRLFLIQSNDGYDRTSVVWKVHATAHIHEENNIKEKEQVEGVKEDKHVVSVTSSMKQIDLTASADTAKPTPGVKVKSADAVEPTASAGADTKKTASTYSASSVNRTRRPGSALHPGDGESMLSLSIDVRAAESGAPRQGGEQYCIFQPHLTDTGVNRHLLSDMVLNVQSVQTLVHDLEISCTEMLLSESGDSIRGLYFGTFAGPIYKHNVNIDSNYGEEV